mgnify:CR=1 FL=1
MQKTHIVALAALGLSLTAIVPAFAFDDNGIRIESDAHVYLGSETRHHTEIVNIAKERHTVANVGIASIQLINPRGQSIRIRDSHVATHNEFNGGIVNIAHEEETLANVGVGQIAVVQPYR